MRRWLLATLSVAVIYGGCGGDENASPGFSEGGAAGTRSKGGGDDGGGESTTGGGQPSPAGGVASGASGGGGGAGAVGPELDGGAGSLDGGAGSTNLGGASEGGAAGGLGGSGGREEQPPPIVNGCVDFVDARAAHIRVIAWGYALGGDPGRCLLIQVGQAVVWQGPFATHPIQPAGGTMPSPIIGDTQADATSYQVTFGALGTFGYECGLHASMRGAIRVVD